jgi:excisionase family DNA binding protein
MGRRRMNDQVNLATCERAFISVRAVADYVGCDPRTIIRMIRERSLVAAKVGREWRVSTTDARRAFHVQLHQRAS